MKLDVAVWHSFVEAFEINFLPLAKEKETWDAYYGKLQQLLAYTAEPFVVEGASDDAEVYIEEAAHLLAQAAWALQYKKREAGLQETTQYIDRAMQFALKLQNKEASYEALAHVNYVKAAIERGNAKEEKDFLQSSSSAKKALEDMQAIPHRVTAATLAHTYNQKTLADSFIDAPDKQDIVVLCMEAALNHAKAPVMALGAPYGVNACIGIEGAPMPRTAMNIMQSYPRVELYQEALDYCDGADEHKPFLPQIPDYFAYFYTVVAETYMKVAPKLGVSREDEAWNLVQMADDTYQRMGITGTSNYLRTLITFCEVGSNLGLDVSEEYEAAKALHQTLGFKSGHDYSKRLVALAPALENVAVAEERRAGSPTRFTDELAKDNQATAEAHAAEKAAADAVILGNT